MKLRGIFFICFWSLCCLTLWVTLFSVCWYQIMWCKHGWHEKAFRISETNYNKRLKGWGIGGNIDDLQCCLWPLIMDKYYWIDAWNMGNTCSILLRDLPRWQLMTYLSLWRNCIIIQTLLLWSNTQNKQNNVSKSRDTDPQMMSDFGKFLSFCVSFCFLTYKMGRVIHLLLEWYEWQMKLHKVDISHSTWDSRAFLWMCVSLPFNFPEKSRVVFLGTVCLVTGYKQQYFLGSDSMLIEDSKERKTEEFVSSLVTKVTFCERKSSVNCTHSMGLSFLFNFFWVSHI